MLVTSDVAHDSRVVREAGALAAAGHVVHVQGRDVPGGWRPPGALFTVGSSSGGRGLRSSHGPSPARRPEWVWRVARWWLLPRHRRRVWSAWAAAVRTELRDRRFDVVHAHDFNTLPAGARLAGEQGALLVYDAHEWWSGRQRHGRPVPLERWRERRLEAALTRRADGVVTVAEGIADRLERWSAGPVTVVRNTFPAEPAEPAEPVEAHPAGPAAAGDPGNPPAPGPVQVPLPAVPGGVVYAGRIGAARDLETVLAGAEGRAAVVLVGPADESWTARLTRRRGRPAELLPPRPVDAVDALLRRHGLAVVTLTDSCDNHRLALPNKLFHAVRAGVPVIAADLPELRRTVRRYDLGELYRPGDPASFAAALDRARSRYPDLLRSVAAARPELLWEQDARRLVSLYGELAKRRRPGGGAADPGSGVRRTAGEPV
ncbi:glycosyltransferase [Streptacidiphilus griseoplanus]|uniref:glycosyltransferase n=1 Tax=Peterkaempfera griseoplana TaxID=66896 RepID=UPI000B1DE357|nr:glycosyltransferase [Peterkaempfera griseoplana]